MRRADFRLRWGAIRLHTSVFLFALEGLTQRDAKALTTSARQYAIDHKTGLKAGMGTGTLSVPVFLCANADDAAKRWFTHELAPVFAAMALPVLLDLETGSLFYYRGQWGSGFIFRSYTLGLVTKTIAPAITTAA